MCLERCQRARRRRWRRGGGSRGPRGRSALESERARRAAGAAASGGVLPSGGEGSREALVGVSAGSGRVVSINWGR